MPNYVKPQMPSLKAHPEFKEKWVRARATEESRDTEIVDGCDRSPKSTIPETRSSSISSISGSQKMMVPTILVIPAEKTKLGTTIIQQSNDIDEMIEDAGLEISHVKGWKRYMNFSEGRFGTINPLGHVANLADELRNW